MLYRYLLVLVVTISVYYFPLDYDGLQAWRACSTLSTCYILFIWHFSKIRERFILIGIESFAMISALTAFLSHYETKLHQYMAPELQWFWVNYEHIMGYCFLLEIIAILTGIVRSGEFKRILSLCYTHLHDDKCSNSHILLSEKHLCQNTPEILRTR